MDIFKRSLLNMWGFVFACAINGFMLCLCFTGDKEYDLFQELRVVVDKHDNENTISRPSLVVNRDHWGTPGYPSQEEQCTPNQISDFLMAKSPQHQFEGIGRRKEKQAYSHASTQHPSYHPNFFFDPSTQRTESYFDIDASGRKLTTVTCDKKQIHLFADSNEYHGEDCPRRENEMEEVDSGFLSFSACGLNAVNGNDLYPQFPGDQSNKRRTQKPQRSESSINQSIVLLHEKKEVKEKGENKVKSSESLRIRQNRLLPFLRDKGIQELGNTFSLTRAINDEFYKINQNVDKMSYDETPVTGVDRKAHKKAFHVCKEQVVMVFFGSLGVIRQHSSGVLSSNELMKRGWDFMKGYLEVWKHASLEELINFSGIVDDEIPTAWGIFNEAMNVPRDKLIRKSYIIILLELWCKHSLLSAEQQYYSMYIEPSRFYSICEDSYQMFQRWTLSRRIREDHTRLAAIPNAGPSKIHVSSVLKKNLNISRINNGVITKLKTFLGKVANNILKDQLSLKKTMKDFEVQLFENMVCMYIEGGVGRVEVNSWGGYQTKASNPKDQYKVSMVADASHVAVQYIIPGVFSILKVIHDHQDKEWDVTPMIQHAWQYLHHYFSQWLNKELIEGTEGSIFLHKKHGFKRNKADWSDSREALQNVLEHTPSMGIPHLGVLYLSQQWYTSFVEDKRILGAEALGFDLSPFIQADVYEMYARYESEKRLSKSLGE